MSTNARLEQADMLLWLRVARVCGRLTDSAHKHIRERGLTPAQFDVLAQVGSSRGIIQEELAKRLFVTQGNITQILDRMEKAGLVKRERRARCNRITLTPLGEKLYVEIVPDHESHMASRFKALDKQEREQLSALLRKLDRGLRADTHK